MSKFWKQTPEEARHDLPQCAVFSEYFGEVKGVCTSATGGNVYMHTVDKYRLFL